MKSFFKGIIDIFWSKISSILSSVISTVLDNIKKTVSDTDLVNKALTAIQAAAAKGLTGDDAWDSAKESLVSSLKDAGKELSDSSINALIETTYDAWKTLGKPTE